jgi:hypothetical protein
LLIALIVASRVRCCTGWLPVKTVAAEPAPAAPLFRWLHLLSGTPKVGLSGQQPLGYLNVVLAADLACLGAFGEKTELTTLSRRRVVS